MGVGGHRGDFLLDSSTFEPIIRFSLPKLEQVTGTIVRNAAELADPPYFQVENTDSSDTMRISAAPPYCDLYWDTSEDEPLLVTKLEAGQSSQGRFTTIESYGDIKRPAESRFAVSYLMPTQEPSSVNSAAVNGSLSLAGLQIDWSLATAAVAYCVAIAGYEFDYGPKSPTILQFEDAVIRPVSTIFYYVVIADATKPNPHHTNEAHQTYPNVKLRINLNEASAQKGLKFDNGDRTKWEFFQEDLTKRKAGEPVKLQRIVGGTWDRADHQKNEFSVNLSGGKPSPLALGQYYLCELP